MSAWHHGGKSVCCLSLGLMLNIHQAAEGYNSQNTESIFVTGDLWVGFQYQVRQWIECKSYTYKCTKKNHVQQHAFVCIFMCMACGVNKAHRKTFCFIGVHTVICVYPAKKKCRSYWTWLHWLCQIWSGLKTKITIPGRYASPELFRDSDYYRRIITKW